ncbi:U-box domain-containing protein 19-like [Amaranthus tricolor]|uniref:U-box domain-containing protein 19-like n=1 Tax=Amaranthus tricolor TaxID=29722 RepID=UPI00258BC701|nr:U-box domain-containing protein 19-like [Amaranthus tricolor]
MLYNSTESTRRTFFFPAVKPSESVSITTLLNSLISLSKQILNFNNFNEFVFISNKRNAKNAIRLVQVLELFLQGLKNDDLFDKMGKTVILPLLDLHVALQKLNFLFEDYTRRDARMWMLVKSELVGRHFRVLIGSVFSSVEAIGLDGIWGWDDEVRDLGLFIIRQGKEARFEAQTEDVWAFNLVKLALGQFESRVIPNPRELRWVMDYLGIKKWTDCNEQIKFLEEETGSGSSSAARLMGLMVYCRCVLFDHIDEGDSTRNEGNDYKYQLGFINPDDIKCPISLEIMVDPVTISTGHTYERVNILKWFKAGNPTCPKTGQSLQSLDIVPNLALKEVIKQYCSKNGVTFPMQKEKGSTKKSCVNNVANLAARMVADFLSIKLAMGTIGEKSKAAYEIRLLTKRNVFNRACFIESGVIPYLLNLLLSKDSTAQENSIAALLNLSKHPESKPVIANNTGLTMIIRVLKKGLKMEARQHAAATLFYLSEEQNRELIGSNPDTIPSLVELIRIGGDQGKKNALVSIFSLLLHTSNHSKVLKVGLVPLLIDLLCSNETNDDLIVDSLAVLAALAEKPDGARAILHARIALDVVVNILCSTSSDFSRLGREHSVSLLVAMCTNCGTEVVEVLVKNTCVMGALYSLLVEGTSRAGKKARSLITILLDFSERSSSRSSMHHALPHDNFIHVW